MPFLLQLLLLLLFLLCFFFLFFLFCFQPVLSEKLKRLAHDRAAEAQHIVRVVGRLACEFLGNGASQHCPRLGERMHARPVPVKGRAAWCKTG